MDKVPPRSSEGKKAFSRPSLSWSERLQVSDHVFIADDYRPLESNSPVAHRGLRILRSLAKGAPTTTSRPELLPSNQVPNLEITGLHEHVDVSQAASLGNGDTFSWLFPTTQQSTSAPTLQDICNMNIEDLATMDFGNADFTDSTAWAGYPN